MQSSTRRFRLRELTSPAHASLDQLIGEFGSHADYERYVLGIHAFRIPLEEQLAATNWPEVFGDWRPQLIGPALRADIVDLGLTPFARADRLQLPDTIESLLGRLYVLEGSALGARILYRRAQNIGLSEIRGARHLALQSGSPDHWRSFLAILERAAPVDLPGVVAASNAVFEAARQAFREFDDVDRQPG